jgi:cbb3-type cytochrome oxidase maturation protein
MNIIYFLLPMALLLGLSFVVAFVFSSWKGQFDDLDTPAHRMLLDDEDISDSKKGNTT